ncbi:MAG: hypothetical protein WC306_03340 [Candidatus Paceibacterota bacterium]|jgi:hypothetical protein
MSNSVFISADISGSSRDIVKSMKFIEKYCVGYQMKAKDYPKLDGTDSNGKQAINEPQPMFEIVSNNRITTTLNFVTEHSIRGIVDMFIEYSITRDLSISLDVYIPESCWQEIIVISGGTYEVKSQGHIAHD